MDHGEIRQKIQEAKQLVGGDPQDPLTQIAFREVLRTLLQGSARPPAGQVNLKGDLAVGQMQISEFLAPLKIGSDTDRLVAILYYYLGTGRGCSTRAEILQAYSSARARKPVNLSDVVARCIKKGYLVEASEKKDNQKAWQITTTGEKYVREELAP